MPLAHSPISCAGTAWGSPTPKLDQLSQLAESWVLLELFGQTVAVFSSYQLERAKAHHQMAKPAPVPVQGREQDRIAAVQIEVAEQSGKGQLTTLPEVHTK